MRNFIRLIENMQYEMFPPNNLYHTTSPAAAFEILDSHELRPKNGNSFVSFSLKPHLHDIQAHGAVIVFDLRKLYSQIEPVEYSETWAKNHPEQMSYIAGEGWSEQFTYDPEDDSEDDEFDDEGYELAYAYAELESFLQKSDEDEWISISPGRPVKFTPNCVTGLIIDDGDVAVTSVELQQLGYGHIKVSCR